MSLTTDAGMAYLHELIRQALDPQAELPILLRCPDCNLQLPSAFVRDSHFDAHVSKQLPEGYTCEKCGKKFEHATSLTRHVSRAHGRIRSLQSFAFCSRTLRNRVAKVRKNKK